MEKKEADNKPILYGIIGFLAGALIFVLLTRSAVNSNNTGMMSMMGMNQRNEMMDERQEIMMEDHDEDMSMAEMVDQLQGKTGDEFDMEFIQGMIKHHQGAIDMANLAKASAKHQEIKDLAGDIIAAQTKEIEMMKEWQSTWGY